MLVYTRIYQIYTPYILSIYLKFFIRSSGVVIKSLRNNIIINAIKPLTFSILFMRRVLIS